MTRNIGAKGGSWKSSGSHCWASASGRCTRSASQGLLVVYRGSGVLNFAHGAIGMIGAYVAWEMRVEYELPVAVAWSVGIAASAVIGALTHLLIMRQLRRASPLARIVATLGVLIVLQAAAVLRYGSVITFVDPELPTTLVEPFGVAISVDRFILLGIAAVLQRGAVGPLPLLPVRAVDHRGRREPAPASSLALVTRPHRHRQLGARFGPGRRGRHPHRAHRPAPGAAP